MHDSDPAAARPAPAPAPSAASKESHPRSARPRRLLVVHNPVAGGRRLRRFQATLAELRALGCAVDVRRTGAPGDAAEIATAADGVDALVIAGGDGTVNEALNGLARAARPDLPLAVIPMGTANVLAAELGLPADPAALARAIAHGPAIPAHLGRANGRRFALMAGAGFDAHVVAAVRTAVKRRLGKAAYLVAALEVALGFPHPRYRVEIDGEPHEAASVVVCKGHFYAGRYVLAPDARPWEPDLHVCLFQRSGPLQPLRYALAMQLGRLRRLPDFQIVRARHVRIAGPDGDPVQGDGDLMTGLPLEVELLPDAARLIVAEAPTSRA